MSSNIESSRSGRSVHSNVVEMVPARPGVERHVGAPTPPNDGLASLRVIAAADWDVMFNAVEARVVEIAEAAPAVDDNAAWQGVAESAHDGLLECASAMNQLHVLLGRERTRHRAQELALQRAQADLAQVQVQLIGTEARALQARHRALHDDLTRLPNRSHFIERLDQALADAMPTRQSLATLYLDLDGFKAINDLHGHAVGDQVLKVIGARLMRAVRAEDMVCRIGGDEFACLLLNLPDRAQLEQLVLKLIQVLSAPLKIGALELQVRVSIGIATYPVDGTTSDALLRSADAAMYSARRQQTCCAFAERVEPQA